MGPSCVERVRGSEGIGLGSLSCINGDLRSKCYEGARRPRLLGSLAGHQRWRMGMSFSRSVAVGSRAPSPTDEDDCTGSQPRKMNSQEAQ